MPAWIKERFAAARAGDALALEQAQLRLTIMVVIEAYFAVAFLWDRILDDAELSALATVAVGFVLAVAHLGWMFATPGVNHPRRHASVVLDMGTITLAMLVAGETGAMLYGLYLWVVIGNGFRFGRWYLHFAQAVSLAGFSAVLFVSAFWRQHTMLGAALFIALLAVPWYVSLLIARLQAASQRLQEARGEAESANIAKTKFLAAASHDLRQPMQALSMYASVLEERLADSDALRVVHGVQLSVQTLERMFDSLLDISKIESGIIKPSVVAFPLMPLIEHVVEAEKPLAARKRLELRVVRTSISVRSDPALLERMLKNLVTNAIRYTESGKIVVGCRRVTPWRPRLEVADSGIGIPTSEQERIFHEYYQVGGAGAQGLGLGLPIVKSLGELLGHAVSVRSAPGRGSVFSIELERAPEMTAPAHAGEALPPALSNANVVLVDDDVEIRNSMRLLLESWGCRYISGASAAEVEAKLRRERLVPDALIVDYRLADAMTGLEVIERLREAFGQKLPALIITGTPSLLDRQFGGIQFGGIPFAVKPVPPGKLRAFLSQVAKEKS
jgi:signal transduction histidine kinase/CheY-like chemotaxis protein